MFIDPANSSLRSGATFTLLVTYYDTLHYVLYILSQNIFSHTFFSHTFFFAHHFSDSTFDFSGYFYNDRGCLRVPKAAVVSSPHLFSVFKNIYNISSWCVTSCDIIWYGFANEKKGACKIALPGVGGLWGCLIRRSTMAQRWSLRVLFFALFHRFFIKKSMKKSKNILKIS